MKIIVFGATGGTGKNVVAVAAKAGHEVVAIARKPDAIEAAEHVTVKKGDVLDAASIAPSFEGCDAIICAIGPAKNSAPGTLISEGVNNILAGAKKSGVKRFVFESGMICSDGKELSFFGSFAVWAFGTIYPKLKADKVIAEKAIRESDLDWVIVRPPALSHDPATGKYTAAPGAKIFPGASLPHGDCADALVRAATESDWVKQIVNVGK